MIDWSSFVGGAAFGAILAALGIAAFFLIAALYVYVAFALMTIGKKLKYKYPWIAWIPIANIAMILQLGGFHWAWVFLVLVPVLGWIALAVLEVIAFWRILERRKYPGMLSLLLVLGIIPKIGGLAFVAFLVVLGFAAWKRK